MILQLKMVCMKQDTPSVFSRFFNKKHYDK